jgi:hypothetical protein
MRLGQVTPEEQVLQEVLLVQHLLGNQLSRAASRAQLLSFEPELSPALHPSVAEIVDAVLAAGHTLQRLQELTSPRRA